MRALYTYERTPQVREGARVKDLNSRVVLSLKGVTVSGHLALAASVGDLNQTPRWYIWIGPVSGFGETLGN